MKGAWPFSEWNELLPFIAIQRPAGAIAILLRQQPLLALTKTTKCAQPKLEHTLHAQLPKRLLNSKFAIEADIS